MVSYPENFYHKQKYTISKADGEARDFFGDVRNLAPENLPTIEFNIDCDYTVTFTLDKVAPSVTRKLSDEAGARFISKASTVAWPSTDGIIMGFLNKGSQNVGTTQQLFIMWVQPRHPMTDMKDPLELKIFFFNTNDCFSGGNSDIDGRSGGTGQINGSVVGNGPNTSP